MRKNPGLYTLLFLIIFIGCSRNSEKDRIKVMTLNVRYDNPSDSINGWHDRKSIITNFIEEEKPDLLGMQEVLFHQYEFLDSVLTEYSSAGVGRIDGAKEGEMNPVFFRKERFDMTRTKTFWLSETPEVAGSQAWGASLPRIVTWVELVDKNSHQHLFYFNTHFAHDSDSARILSSKLLLRKVDSLAAGFVFIITGDFNMLPSTEGYGILTGPAESIPLLDDTFSKSDRRPEGPGYTFNGFSDKEGDGRIDFIFVKEGLKVISHKTVIRKDHGIYISDHWPVEAVVLLK
jgi:endonuclease/exonuclease/phosphatase family metal-dependent hydrolase